MGTEVVELRLPDGVPVLVRAERIEGANRFSADGEYAGPADSGFGGPSDVGFASHSFELVTRTVRGVAVELHKALEAVSPTRASVEIGFDLAINGSQLVALVASGGVHAALKVRLEWGGDSTAAIREQADDATAASSG